MMGIEVKSTATLIDELFTTLLKCFHWQEVVMTSSDDLEVARAAKLAQETNSRRNLLVTAIDTRLGEGATTALIKTYTSEEIRKRFEEVENENRSSPSGQAWGRFIYDPDNPIIVEFARL